MPLNWNLTSIEDHKDLCWRPTQEEPGKVELQPVTNVLILLLGLHLGIHELTAKNVEKAYGRYLALCRALGYPLGVSSMEKGDRLLTLAEFRAHIGLHTNGVVYTDSQFRRHLLKDIILPDAQRDLAKAKANPTAKNWTEETQ